MLSRIALSWRIYIAGTTLLTAWAIDLLIIIKDLIIEDWLIPILT